MIEKTLDRRMAVGHRQSPDLHRRSTRGPTWFSSQGVLILPSGNLLCGFTPASGSDDPWWYSLRMNLMLILILAWFQGNEWDKANREVVRLAPSSFKQLPRELTQELERRGCTVPQVWGSRQPGNVIRGEFLKKGQSDWAALCSVNLKSSILVFVNGSPGNPINIADAEDLNMLQGVGKGQIGYSRQIVPVDEKYIMDHYHAYGGPKPPPIDHLGINDAFVGKASVVLYFYQGKWLHLTGAD